MKEENNLKYETIDELLEGEPLFESTGYAVVKVTKGGEEKGLRLPIKSTGVDEFMDKLADLAPQPPVIERKVVKDSENGKALGLDKDSLVQMFDLTDEAYMEKLKAHNQDFIWRVVLFALNFKFKTKDGREPDYEAKKAVLKSSGITWAHINQIYVAVQNLTQFAGEREDFLSANASG